MSAVNLVVTLLLEEATVGISEVQVFIPSVEAVILSATSAVVAKHGSRSIDALSFGIALIVSAIDVIVAVLGVNSKDTSIRISSRIVDV